MTHDTKHTMGPAARRLALAATTALALSFAAASGHAQPAGPGPGGGPWMHGPHGGGGDMLVGALQHAKASLNLTPAQQQAWDNAVAAGKAARQTARTNMQKVKDALTAELANPVPNLAAVATVADGVEQANRDLRIQVRNQWLALYGTFSTDQVAIVRDLLQKRMARAEAFHQQMIERMRERFGGGAG